MAHIAVYLQRTPAGLHPASAVALCWARDIASERGATVIAVTRGDAGPWDRTLAASAGRFGADVVLFGGYEVLPRLERRLHPTHVFVPWTLEGLRAAEELPHRGPPIPRWLEHPHPPWHGGDAISVIVAGRYPWYELPTVLEGEYEQDVDEVALPDWLAEASEPPSLSQRSWSAHVPSNGLPKPVLDALERLGIAFIASAPPSTENPAGADPADTLTVELAFGTCPPSWTTHHHEPAELRVLLPGTTPVLAQDWVHASWVLRGDWSDVLTMLAAPPWRASAFR